MVVKQCDFFSLIHKSVDMLESAAVFEFINFIKVCKNDFISKLYFTEIRYMFHTRNVKFFYFSQVIWKYVISHRITYKKISLVHCFVLYYKKYTMKYTQKASSLIEAMIIMTIIAFWVTGVYNFYISSQTLAFNTGKRIVAIQIAREWLEAMTNIRNTNWLLYPADYKNCWNNSSYNDAWCVGDSWTSRDIAQGSYTVVKDTDERWTLQPESSSVVHPAQDYRTKFALTREATGFYTQSGTNTNPDFTRELIINYPWGNTNTGAMDIRSIVHWGADSHKVELNLTLTNWKDTN